MPENGRAVRASAREILNFEEIERFVRIAAALGVTKLRVTGGEPLVRRDLPVLIRTPGGDSGHSRSGAHHQRRAAGRSRPGRFTTPACGASTSTWIRSTASASRRSRGATISTRVLAGIEAAPAARLRAIKLNAVAVKNLVEPDIVPLARFGRERGFEVRYIEFMPLDAQGLWDRGKVLLADEMIAMLSREIAPLDAGARSRSARARHRIRLRRWRRHAWASSPR